MCKITKDYIISFCKKHDYLNGAKAKAWEDVFNFIETSNKKPKFILDLALLISIYSERKTFGEIYKALSLEVDDEYLKRNLINF